MRPRRAVLGLAALGALATAATAQVPPALRLPAGPRPIRQSVELTLRPDQETFAGRTEIEIELPQAVTFLWLHGRELTVREADARQGSQTVAARVQKADEYLGFTFARPVGPGRVRLSVAYDGKLNRTDTQGLFTQQEAGDWYAFSQFEATDARRAFPGFDEPSYKIPWTVTLRVPQGLVALSNTPEASSQALPDGLKAVRFAETPPMPSYLVAIAVGPFELVDVGRLGRQGIPARIATPRGRAGEAAWAVEATREIVPRLEDYFDIPYPYAKLDQVAIPIAVSFGAMENAGLVTYQQDYLLRKPAEAGLDFKRLYASVAAHEVGHMWFGNLVTAAWWDDIWLNEAFANWTSTKIVEAWKPEWQQRAEDLATRSLVMGLDSLSTARRIRQPIASQDDIDNAFDSITYVKGQAVLEMFESWLGAEAFQRGVRLYLRRHSWQNATAADFLKALDQAAGSDVSGAFSTFLDQTGVPLVKARLDCGGGPPRLQLSQVPYHPIGARTAEARSWRIPVCARYGGSPSGRQCALLSSASLEMPLTGATACPSWVVPNAAGAGYYRSTYDAALLEQVRKDGAAALSLPERMTLVNDLVALVGSGDLKAGEALALVPAVANDSNRQLLAAAAGIVDKATTDILPEDAQERFARFMRETYGPLARTLGWVPRPGEDQDTRLQRVTVMGLAAQRGDDPVLGAQAIELAQRWLDDPGAIDPDLVSVVLRVAARQGGRPVFERYRAAAYGFTDRMRRRRILNAMASFRDPSLLPEVFALALDERLDPRETLQLALDPGGGDPRNRRPAWELFKKRFDALVARQPRESLGNLPFAAVHLCDPQDRADVEAFFRPRVADLSGAPRHLDQVLEAIDLCIAFRDAQQANVLEFLARY